MNPTLPTQIFQDFFMRWTRFSSVLVWSSVAIALFPLGRVNFANDVVLLKDGMRLNGTVRERGGNSVEVITTAGARRVLKRDVMKFRFDPNRKASTLVEKDHVVRWDNHRIFGEVELLLGGEQVQVTLETGSRVVLPRGKVARIVRKGERIIEDTATYTQELSSSMERALDRLDGAPGAEFDESEKFLVDCGVFAISRVEERLREKEAAAPGADDPTQSALRRIVYVNELKTVIDSKLEEVDSRVYKIFALPTGGHTEDSAREKKEFLMFAFQRYTEETSPLAVFLAGQDEEEDWIRAWAIEFLRVQQRHHGLLDIHRSSGGQAQLAAAIALGKNRILLGVPTLIEALEIDSLEVRELAGSSLRKFCGVNFRFRADGAPAARADAVKEWWGWWQRNERKFTEQAGKILRHEELATDERRQATKLWREAGGAVHEGNLPRAEAMLRAALELDPTFESAQLSFAVLLYSRLDKPREALGTLENLKERCLVSETLNPSQVLLHLGHCNHVLGQLDAALKAYRQSLARQPDNVQAAIALARTQVEWVDRSAETTTREQRLEGLSQALKRFDEAMRLVVSAREELTLLGVGDLPVEDVLPFDRREHNREVAMVRGSFRMRRAQLALEAAKLEARLGRSSNATARLSEMLLEVTQEEGKDWRALETEIRTYLGLVLEGSGQASLALRQFRIVLQDLDPERDDCQRGVRRLDRSQRSATGN